jgi:hypothetical protein
MRSNVALYDVRIEYTSKTALEQEAVRIDYCSQGDGKPMIQHRRQHRLTVDNVTP